MPTINALGKSERGMDTFLTYKSKNAKNSSLRIYTNHIGIARRFSPKPLLDLTEDEANIVASKLSKKKSGPTVATTVKAFLRFHKKPELADCFGLRRRRRRLSPKQILTVEEIQQMINASPSLRDKCLIAVLYETGARIHEVLALDLDDIAKKEVESKRYYVLFFKKVKVEGEEHCSFLIEGGSYMTAWLNAYPLRKTEVPKAPLFPRMDKLGPLRKLERLGTGGARHIIKKISKKAGIEKRIYPHLFRHSRATHLLQFGFNESYVKKALGWVASSTELDRYSHLTNRDVENALLKAQGLVPETPTEMERLTEILTEELEPIITIETETTEIDDLQREMQQLKEAHVRMERRHGFLFEYLAKHGYVSSVSEIERKRANIASWADKTIEGADEKDMEFIEGQIEKFEKWRDKTEKLYWEERSRARNESK